MAGAVEKMKDSLDGKNVEAVLMEFGTRFHRVIYDHLLQYQYSSMGKYIRQNVRFGSLSWLIPFGHFESRLPDEFHVISSWMGSLLPINTVVTAYNGSVGTEYFHPS